MFKVPDKLLSIVLEWWKKNKPPTFFGKVKGKEGGQSILEVIVAMAIFSLIGAAMATMVVGGFAGLEQGGEQTQAQALAQEGIEAVRAVRDKDWDSLTCTNCVAEISGSEWILSSGANETIGRYMRTITLSDVYRDGNDDIAESGTLDEYTKLAEVEITWTIREGVTNSVQRTAYFTNWWYSAGAECLTINTDNACFDDSSNYKSLINIVLTNSCGEDITIVGTTPSWNNSKRIELVEIDSQECWERSCDWGCTPTGKQDSGIVLDFGDNDLVINSGSSVNINRYQWDGKMSGSSVEIILLFDDDTTATIDSYPYPDCDAGEIDTCATYCQDLGYGNGTCRANSNQCTQNGEIYESGGDQYCTGGGADTCCCAP